MGLVFRAVWQDSVEDPLEFGLRTFRRCRVAEVDSGIGGAPRWAGT